MSDIVNKIYDEMDLSEVICRLPSEFAVSAIKRRLNDLESLKTFFVTRDAGGAGQFKEVKEHVNSLIQSFSIDDIFNTLPEQYHKTLFGWLDQQNKERILNNGKDHLSIPFIFSLTKENDLDGMVYVLDRVLSEPNPKSSKILSILNKVDELHFQAIINKVIKDSRPIVKSTILSVYGKNFNLVSEHQKMMALKAFAKIPASEQGAGFIQSVDFRLFENLKPLERIMALDRYLGYFPKYRKIKVFNPEPTKEEFDSILFAGCFQFNDLVEDIVNKYNDITKNDKPNDKSD